MVELKQFKKNSSIFFLNAIQTDLQLKMGLFKIRLATFFTSTVKWLLWTEAQCVCLYSDRSHLKTSQQRK